MSDCYRDDGTGTEDWGVTRITEQVAAWEPIPAMGAPNRAMLYYRLRTTAEALRLCQWALREPLDNWKGECERKALDASRAILAQLDREGLA